MGRIFLVVGAVAFAATLSMPRADAQSVKRPRSVRGLANHAITALSVGDVNGFLILAPTLQEMTTHCPGIPLTPKAVAKLHAKIARGVARCHRALNWAHATIISVTGGKKKRLVKQCTGVWQLRDVIIELRVGNKTARVRIDNPFILNGNSFGSAGRPRCSGSAVQKVPSPTPPQPRSPAKKKP